MISLKKITKEYNSSEEKIYALKDINLSFEYGKLYAIVGHSGSGKSTLLQIVGLLDTCTSGSINIDGQIVNKKTNEKNKTIIRGAKIGFIFQSFYLDENLNAYENVMMPMYINKKIPANMRKVKAIDLLKNLGLEKRIKHFPKQLSGGEQQRVAIARALANNPKIILADEPTGNLDKNNEKMILDCLRNLVNQNCCIIVATHSELIKTYADVVINLEDGVVIE